MEKISNKKFSQERALYHKKDVILEECLFAGEEDGESALKESRDITIDKCFFDLRYPLWHTENINIINSEFTVNARAAIWYARHININKSKLFGIKVLREAMDISLCDVDVSSPEFAWRCKSIIANKLNVTGEYAFFEDTDVTLNNFNLTGKYSFQYNDGLIITNSKLDTKDAFWHANNVLIRDSIVKSEYLGWYSKNLTMINCQIIGTQPFCYCENLKLINCTMKDCDLAFEYSTVEADIISKIDSVKNPKSGYIKALSIGEIIESPDSVYPSTVKIETIE